MKLLKHDVAAVDHAVQRVFCHMHRDLQLIAQARVKILEQRPSAGHHQTTLYDIRSQLRRRDLHHGAYSAHDLIH